MTPLLATFESKYYASIALFSIIAIGGGVLLKHHGVELPTRLSPEAQRLAKDVNTKLAAIKLHRQQKPGLSLKETKADVEDFAGSLL